MPVPACGFCESWEDQWDWGPQNILTLDLSWNGPKDSGPRLVPGLAILLPGSGGTAAVALLLPAGRLAAPRLCAPGAAQADESEAEKRRGKVRKCRKTRCAWRVVAEFLAGDVLWQGSFSQQCFLSTACIFTVVVGKHFGLVKTSPLNC